MAEFFLVIYILGVENVLIIIATATDKSIKGRKLELTNKKSVD